MKPAERCKQLEKTLREVQDLLRLRDREIEVLQKERDRILAERDQERNLERERESREREREQEREKDRVREREREREKEKERERQPSTTPTQENGVVRRSKSQAPFSKDTHSVHQTNVPILTVESEQLAQLRSLDVFMTKTDGWSGAQVIQAVEDLNSEITHFAASATESCVFERRGRKNRNSGDGRATPTRQAPTQDMLDTVPWLGPAFAKILAMRDHAQDPMLVQLALQASLATCCARSLSLFCVGFPSKLDGLLSSVFGHMQSSEPQPTSSRWRALTHRSIRSLYPGLEEYAISELVTTMLRWSSSVFILSGCTSAPHNNHPKPPSGKEPIVPVLHAATLRAQLRRIAEAVCKLARVTREEILSTSFEVVSVECGGAFEEESMLNAFSDHHEHLTAVNGNRNGRAGKKGQGGNVLCTTELGLKCTTRKGKSIMAVESDAGEQKEDVFERRMLLPPKVVLDSAVDALD
ncbi:hypothetical protein BXZ70DRAFT_1000522 [Cristinia sonorae]|uniref:Uncharacterized protein n=1 Tax=Cristinia sonorae TaxID=1940300 RepID=A0A8K0XPC5_9AGAR|nr:hypothetical protein BXZ70DRAFT_1000522 [Cristinia sonorae]